MSRSNELLDDLAVSDLEDVYGSVWLATALMAYDRAQPLEPTDEPLDEGTFAFRQVDIQQVAQKLCDKKVNNARIGQWTNGDHADNIYNYLREVGTRRRLSRPDEFDSHQVLPTGLLPPDTPVLDQTSLTLTFGDLVDWVRETYPNLVPARARPETPAPPEPAEDSRGQGEKTHPSQAIETELSYPDGILLMNGEEEIIFHRAGVDFEDETRTNAFAEMTSKTTQEILEDSAYDSIKDRVEGLSEEDLSRPVGPVLADLKERGDESYQLFLNDYGDRKYRDFVLEAPARLSKKGLYAFFVDGEVKYIGKTTSSFEGRFNRDYGRISPRSCYLDGQVTNCRLNHRAAEAADRVAIYLCPLAEDTEIGRLEDALIAHYQPEWNIQGTL